MDSGALRVLLVEDDDLDAKLVKYRLDEDAAHEFALETVGTLQSACVRIAKGDIDVILADLTLPDSGDRKNTLATLTHQAPDIPIVVLTGYSDTSFELDSVRSGIQDYVVKDQVTRHLLIRVILHAIERQRLMRENKMLTDQLERLTLLDPLTELYNRRGLQKMLHRETAWVQRTGEELLAILMDLDDFKQVNDTFGYTVGDDVLKQIAGKLISTLRATDSIARIGGDEFVILLPRTHAEDGANVAERIRTAVSEKPFRMDAHEIKVTASLGLIRLDPQTNTVEALLNQASGVLGRGKHEGKNRIHSELKNDF